MTKLLRATTAWLFAILLGSTSAQEVIMPQRYSQLWLDA